MNVQVMSREQCLQRLRDGSVGRVATTYRALPAVVPVRYRVVGDHIVFRSASDALLTRGCDGNVIAFEIDDVAADGASGWSVMVVGTAHLLDDSVALDIGTVSGRAVGAAVCVPA
jgi:nitroimidazol reductase NimA-like FMN-containing flavoprotein (pyridoxamine 5'-phosphate oxidase superfamily)